MLNPERSMLWLAAALTLIVACKPEVQPPTANPTAEEALAWILGELAADAPLTEAEAQTWFAPAFLAQVPAAELIQTFAEVARTLSPLEVVETAGAPPLTLSARLATAAGPRTLDIQMTAQPPRQIAGLLLRGDAPVPSSLDEAVSQLESTGSKSSLLVAELENGACKPLHQHGSETVLAIGSTFKLWVLLALDDVLRRSEATWETPLAIRDELKSLPSGELQDRPAGTELPLREFATKMIAISDNTATDHLIAFVGRQAVEAAQRDAMHSAPELNVPWLTTRELFALKLLATPTELATYRSGDIATKRTMLAELAARPLSLDDAAGWSAPRALDLEWLARSMDVCNVLATLGARAGFDLDSPILRILGTNTGLQVDRSRYRYVGFKGGSEPGVLHVAWLLQRADGRWFVVALGVNDDRELIDENVFFAAASGVLQLVAREVP